MGNLYEYFRYFPLTTSPHLLATIGYTTHQYIELLTKAITKHTNIHSADKTPKGIVTHLVATQIYDQVLSVLSTCGINPIMRTEHGVKIALTQKHTIEDHEKATPLVVDMLIKNDSETTSRAFDAILSAPEFAALFKNSMRRKKKMDDKKCYTNTLCHLLLLVCGQFIDSVLHDDDLSERHLLDQGRQYVGSSTKNQAYPFHTMQLINKEGEQFDVESYSHYKLEENEPLLNLLSVSMSVFHALDTGRANAKTEATKSDKIAAKLMAQWTEKPLFTRKSLRDDDLSTPTSSKRNNGSEPSRTKSSRAARKTDILDSDEEGATETARKANKSPATQTTQIDNKRINLVKDISSTLGSLSANKVKGQKKLIENLKKQFLQLGNSVTGCEAKNCSELANCLAEKEVSPAKVATPSEKTRVEDEGSMDDNTPRRGVKRSATNATNSDLLEETTPTKKRGKKKEESSNEKSKKNQTPKSGKKKKN